MFVLAALTTDIASRKTAVICSCSCLAVAEVNEKTWFSDSDDPDGWLTTFKAIFALVTGVCCRSKEVASQLSASAYSLKTDSNILVMSATGTVKVGVAFGGEAGDQKRNFRSSPSARKPSFFLY